MCMDEVRTTLTASWRERYKADKIRSFRSSPRTSIRALLDDSIDVASASSSSSISALPLIPETLNSSSPTKVIDDCWQGHLARGGNSNV